MGRVILYRLALLPASGSPLIPPRLRGGWRRVAERSEAGWGELAKPCRGKNPTPALHPKSGLPDFGAKHVEFGDSRIRLDGEGESYAASILPTSLTSSRRRNGFDSTFACLGAAESGLSATAANPVMNMILISGSSSAARRASS